MKTTANDRDSVVKALLDKELAVSCLVSLYHSQTESERNWRATTDENRVGFNTGDASSLTQIAERLEWRGGELNEFEHGQLCAVLPKYWRQLLPLCNQKNSGLDMRPALNNGKATVNDNLR